MCRCIVACKGSLTAQRTKPISLHPESILLVHASVVYRCAFNTVCRLCVPKQFLTS